MLFLEIPNVRVQVLNVPPKRETLYYRFVPKHVSCIV